MKSYQRRSAKRLHPGQSTRHVFLEHWVHTAVVTRLVSTRLQAKPPYCPTVLPAVTLVGSSAPKCFHYPGATLTVASNYCQRYECKFRICQHETKPWGKPSQKRDTQWLCSGSTGSCFVPKEEYPGGTQHETLCETEQRNTEIKNMDRLAMSLFF